MEQNEIMQINVALLKKGETSALYGGQKILTRKLFNDFVYQAFFYGGNARIVVGNISFQGRTIKKEKNGRVCKKAAFYYEKVANYLWTHIKDMGSFQFHSDFEHIEYIITNINK